MSDAGTVTLGSALVDAMRRAVADGLSNGTSGNASALLPDGRVLITPSGIAPDGLVPESMAVLAPDGTVLSEGPPPSTEVAMHLAVYAAAPAARAVMHTHSPFATAVACACRVLPAIHYDIVGLGGPLRVAPYVVFGSPALAEVCAAALQGRSAALLANHGAVAYGATMRQAYDRAAKAEWLATLYWRARQLGDPQLLDADQLDEVRAQMARYRYGTR